MTKCGAGDWMRILLADLEGDAAADSAGRIAGDAELTKRGAGSE
ncbi:hypothetical protein [Paenibacillus donghaensis]|nr:hypothetical protein [Paenibacillus donghaensis]